MRTVFFLLTAAAVLASAPPANADNLKQRLAKVPAPAFVSEKSAGDIEYCISLGTAQWMHPNTLRGEHTVTLYGTPDDNLFGLVFYAIVISDSGAQRTIAFNAHPSWNGRTERLIRSCV